MNDCSNKTVECSESNVAQDDCRSACASPCDQKKIPLWATLLAAGGFIIFNVIFLAYAMSISSGAPE